MYPDIWDELDIKEGSYGIGVPTPPTGCLPSNGLPIPRCKQWKQRPVSLTNVKAQPLVTWIFTIVIIMIYYYYIFCYNYDNNCLLYLHIHPSFVSKHWKQWSVLLGTLLLPHTFRFVHSTICQLQFAKWCDLAHWLHESIMNTNMMKTFHTLHRDNHHTAQIYRQVGKKITGIETTSTWNVQDYLKLRCSLI